MAIHADVSHLGRPGRARRTAAVAYKTPVHLPPSITSTPPQLQALSPSLSPSHLSRHLPPQLSNRSKHERRGNLQRWRARPELRPVVLAPVAPRLRLGVRLLWRPHAPLLGVVLKRDPCNRRESATSPSANVGCARRSAANRSKVAPHHLGSHAQSPLTLRQAHCSQSGLPASCLAHACLASALPRWAQSARRQAVASAKLRRCHDGTSADRTGYRRWRWSLGPR